MRKMWNRNTIRFYFAILCIFELIPQGAFGALCQPLTTTAPSLGAQDFALIKEFSEQKLKSLKCEIAKDLSICRDKSQATVMIYVIHNAAPEIPSTILTQTDKDAADLTFSKGLRIWPKNKGHFESTEFRFSDSASPTFFRVEFDKKCKQDLLVFGENRFFTYSYFKWSASDWSLEKVCVPKAISDNESNFKRYYKASYFDYAQKFKQRIIDDCQTQQPIEKRFVDLNDSALSHFHNSEIGACLDDLAKAEKLLAKSVDTQGKLALSLRVNKELCTNVMAPQKNLTLQKWCENYGNLAPRQKHSVAALFGHAPKKQECANASASLTRVNIESCMLAQPLEDLEPLNSLDQTVELTLASGSSAGTGHYATECRPIEVHDWSFFSSLKKLKKLSLNNISIESLKEVPRLEALNNLDLFQLNYEGNESGKIDFTPLSKNSLLKELSFTPTNAANETVLWNTLPLQIEELTIEVSDAKFFSVLTQLKMSHLKVLQLKKSYSTSEAADGPLDLSLLKGFTNLKKIEIHDFAFKKDALKSLPFQVLEI